MTKRWEHLESVLENLKMADEELVRADDISHEGLAGAFQGIITAMRHVKQQMEREEERGPQEGR